MSIATTGPDEPTSRSADDFLKARDPFALFGEWFADATAHEINDPNAMAVATVDADGLPNVRITLLKELDEAQRGADRGFVFYTNFEGAKGREILASGKAALNFHWKTLRRQVRIRGLVQPVADAEADAYFASRPRQSQVGAWASAQSREMPHGGALQEAVTAKASEFPEAEAVPRPPHWSGFRVTPLEIEFWHDRPFRLHDRLVFRRAAAGEAWVTAQLYP
ncbi:MAG: pyridoxamine 5'-phosphate oxidase [Pseudomonadota bacterium]